MHWFKSGMLLYVLTWIKIGFSSWADLSWENSKITKICVNSAYQITFQVIPKLSYSFSSQLIENQVKSSDVSCRKYYIFVCASKITLEVVIVDEVCPILLAKSWTGVKQSRLYSKVCLKPTDHVKCFEIHCAKQPMSCVQFEIVFDT